MPSNGCRTADNKLAAAAGLCVSHLRPAATWRQKRLKSSSNPLPITKRVGHSNAPAVWKPELQPPSIGNS